MEVQFFSATTQAKGIDLFAYGLELSELLPPTDCEPKSKLNISALEQALAMRDLLTLPDIQTKADIARHLGLSRARVTQTLNLLNLAPEIRKFLLRLPEEKKASFTERRLRHITRITDAEEQLLAFDRLLSAM